MTMALGRRCAIGCLTWPDDKKKYKTCPVCGEPTTRYRGVTVADEDEINAAMFEAYYAEYDEKLSSLRPNRFALTPEETLYWDGKYPKGRPDPPKPKTA
jgi:hypothetical protein